VKAFTLFAWASILVLAGPTHSLATEIPAQLINKTIHVAYTSTRSHKLEDGGSRTSSKDVSFLIYISSAGRIFSRFSESTRRNQLMRESAPGVTLWHMVGRSLVATAARASGALMQTISFGPDFRSCDITVVAGRENGKAYRWKGLNGKIYEADGPLSISQRSCSVADGNGL
jgi:hypothetical protein